MHKRNESEHFDHPLSLATWILNKQFKHSLRPQKYSYKKEVSILSHTCTKLPPLDCFLTYYLVA